MQRREQGVEEGKTTDDDKCIWGDAIECPVRKELHRQMSLSQRMKPTGEAGMMADMMGAAMSKVPIEIAYLHYYCPSCIPHQAKMMQELDLP